MNNEEEWKSIKNYPKYLISNFGRVKSLKFGKERIRILTLNRYGYLRVNLSFENKCKSFTIHKLVANAFLKKLNFIQNEVNHINGIKTNNFLTNLEWCTSSENKKHAYKLGLIQPSRGELQGLSKLKEYQVLAIREEYKKEKITLIILSKKYLVSFQQIHNIIIRKTWKHI